MDETQKLLRVILERMDSMAASITALTNRMDRLERGFEEIKAIMATKEDLTKYATKEDLAKFATKEDLAKYATKEDLAKLATKEDLAKFATKEDLAMMMESCATKEDVQALDKKFNEADKLHHLKHAYQDQEVMIIKQKLAL